MYSEHTLQNHFRLGKIFYGAILALETREVVIDCYQPPRCIDTFMSGRPYVETTSNAETYMYCTA